MKYDTPLTKQLIAEIKYEYSRRGQPIIDLLEEINKCFTSPRFEGESGKVYFYHIMNTDGPEWSCPSAEIALVLQKILQKLTENV